MNKSVSIDDDECWYKDAIIYELHIRAFRDANGDGIGDFEGLIDKLDHLEELGVTAIWILPFYPSPLKDDGYDISDYYSINPAYGDLKWFRKFLKEAHKRNMKVITELVINHTSDEHEWFKRAKKSPKGSSERNYYVWSDDPGVYKDVRIIFQDFESSNWSWDDEAQQYYWHRFFHHQPDLNFDNPSVHQEVFKIIDHWCQLGVDGFRLDAVPYLYERENTNGENLPETHLFLKKLRAYVDKNYPGTVLLAEANMWPEEAASYFGDGDECHMNYHFPLMPRMFMTVLMEDKFPIIDIFDQTPPIPSNCQWALFLRNHDELTLEMVTDEERDYMYRAYARDPKARINLGIRHRLAPLMENDRRKIELMNSLLFSMPGTPVIYYGDEIGMGDNFYLGDRDGVRTPMQWSPDRNGGFSNANPQILYLPVILDPAYHYEAVNVETQRSNTSSLFWFMKRLINTRKKHKAFGRGDMKFVNVENPKVIAFTRTYHNETILVIANLSKFSQPAEVDLASYAGYTPVEIFSKNNFPLIKEGAPYFFTLSPYSFQWFTLSGVEDLSGKKQMVPFVQVENWEELFTGEKRKKLEGSIIPSYIVNMNWFAGKGRMIFSSTISDQFSIITDDIKITLLLVDIYYKSGLPESYQLPITFLKNSVATTFTKEFPQSVLAEIQVGNEKGVLYDAWYTGQLQRWLYDNMLMGKSNGPHRKGLYFSGEFDSSEFHEHKLVSPRIFSAPAQNNMAVIYDNIFFLKIYRKIETGEHPDVEISRYLSRQADFRFTPGFYGSLEWKTKKGLINIGMVQEMVENNGDGYTYMLERMNNYLERVLALKSEDLKMDFSHPSNRNTEFDQLSGKWQVLLGANAVRKIELIGKRIGEMHLLLASARKKEFSPEPFSLHYQRSLFSAMHSFLSEAFNSLARNKKNLPQEQHPEIEKLLDSKTGLIDKLKRLYSKRLDIIKTRIHGNLNLRQVLLTSRDISIHDFGGDTGKIFSDRRLKRSPLRDVASMIRSIYYVGYEGFQEHTQASSQLAKKLAPFATIWTEAMASFFQNSYLETVQGSALIPSEKENIDMLLDSYLIEKASIALEYELRIKSENVMIPIRMLNSLSNTL